MTQLATLFKSLGDFIKNLNTTSIKRIVIYVIIAYPIFFTVFFKDELLILIQNYQTKDLVKVRNLDIANSRCFKLRETYSAEAVMLYVYQPDTSIKTHKERFAISIGPSYKTIEDNENVQLVTRTHVIEDLRKKGYSKITKTSNHVLSNILFSYDLEVAYVVPIKDVGSNSIVGEVIYIFKKFDESIKIEELMSSAQMFSYDI